MRLLKYINEYYELPNMDSIWSILKRDCSSFLREIGLPKNSTNIFDYGFFKGVNNVYDPKILDPVKVTKRKPLGTNIKIFPYVNKWLTENGNCSRDKCVIASGSYDHIKYFGGEHRMIFPIGDFKYTFVKSQDFNISSKNYETDRIMWAIVQEFPDELQDFVYYFDEVTGQKRYFNKSNPLKENLDYLRKNNIKIGLSYLSYKMHKREYAPIKEYDKLAKEAYSYFVSNKNIKEAHDKGYEIWFDCKSYYSFPVEWFTSIY